MQRSILFAVHLILTLLLSGNASSLRAEDGLLNKKLRAAIKLKLQETAEQQQAVFQRYMVIKVGEIQRVCELDDSQVKRLTIAAKGAVERFTERWKDGTVTWLLRMAGDIDGDADIDQMAADFADEDMMEQFELIMGVGVVTEAICRQPIWENALEKSLESRQKATYEVSETKRQQVRRVATTDYLISILDQEFLLTADQQQKIRPLVEDMIANNHLQNFRGTIMGSFLLSVNLYKMPRAKLAKVMTAEQIKIWDTKLKKYEMYFEMEDDELYGPWRELLAAKPQR